MMISSDFSTRLTCHGTYCLLVFVVDSFCLGRPVPILREYPADLQRRLQV